jgi:hypothetical protein
MAGRIEGYREHWGVQPEQLRERPADRCQAEEWDLAIETARVLMPPPAPSLSEASTWGSNLGW